MSATVWSCGRPLMLGGYCCGQLSALGRLMLCTPDDAAPDRVIERESNGPHVADHRRAEMRLEDEITRLHRRIRAAEKCITDSLTVARAQDVYESIIVAYANGMTFALRALRGEL